MSAYMELMWPASAEARHFDKSDERGAFSVVEFSDGENKAKIFTRDRSLAADLAQVFEMRAKDSPFLGALDLLLTAEADPNRDTIGDVICSLQSRDEDCCPACGQYRPGENKWHDGRLMCDDCCDAEAAQHSADMGAARLDAADHAYDAARDADLTPCHLRPVIEAHRIAQEGL